ncbi:phosphate transport system regulatory protein PhoU [Mycobacterium sp. 852002-53434_SCH5985345]|uniref:phosphate signaling complex protein PhoU n=1 Tax=unclassified Mycobacterium TaxID=2642494 RepID=UPI0007FC6116|nr:MULTISPECIES: phosphate signaling complex protein PhoU [unclassified Mycobacterium]OBF58181.1 phosphate transport system regulatory protein PhoU [Mycobacterium sp. 852002-53434_SCH5985345]OBF78599.1 phosphate transport system regulatory protein PhoU [Mycobacterium sp. 852002-51613_SCH5001154]OBF93650.1 phosphate transport system regulatory protein PhoU [Mycobacterium sp. 852014-52450_SCH5900713]
MRTAYHHQLAELTVELSQMCGLANDAMRRATEALLEADLDAAEQVIREHDRMVVMRAGAEREAFALLALQQPVAGELRAVFSAIQLIADIERMGALAVHVAKIARREHPNQVLPENVRACFAEMAKVAIALGDSATQVLISHDPQQAARLREQDDAMDELYRQLFSVLLDDDWTDNIPVAVDAALLGRFYERFADHAVEVGRRVVFMVSGDLPAPDEISTY